MKISSDKRVEKTLETLSRVEEARVDRLVQLFTEKGFYLDQRYLKKLTSKIWELRPGKIRLLFGIVEGEAIIVNVFTKKTNKTPLRELKLSERRLLEYI